MDNIKTFFSNIWTLLKAELLEKNVSPKKKAASIGLGIFFSILPIWSAQTIAALATAHLLKLHKGIVLLAVSVSTFPVMPFILYVSFVVGGFFLEKRSNISFHMGLKIEDLMDYLYQYLLGSFILAPLAGIFFGILSFVTFSYLSGMKRAKNSSNLS